jgi:beta-glucosidase
MVAQESIVLIKNKGLLPLDKNIQSIAVIGPNANNPISQLGDWTGPQPRQNILTVLDGIVNKACSKTNVYYAQGSQLTEFSPIPKQFLSTPDKKHHELYRDLIDEAIKLASKADIAVVVLGDSPILNGEKHARSDLDLPKPQQRLIKAIYNTGTPTVVVLINAKPLAINWIVENIPAIVEAWNPGVEGGSAIADVLFGDYNPGGKLPITFPHSVGELPSYYNYKPGWHAESYMFTTGKPLFPFGHGLSYTKFKYSNFSITPQKVTREHFAVHIGVNVKNIGRVSGDEVVQLYVNDVVSSVITPLQELKGFKRITLNPGEEKLVEFTLTKEQLSLIARDMKKTLEPGEFEVMVGSSSQDIRLKEKFEVL